MAVAQSSADYTSRVWQFEDGLPSNTVQAIMQTHDGYLWVGTQKGLARFDGVSFAKFDSKNTPELKNSSITCLCETRDHTLWIGTDGGGITHWRNGAFTPFNDDSRLPSPKIKVLFESGKGVLWIGTLRGAATFENGQLQPAFSVEQNAHNEVVRTISEDQEGAIWVGVGYQVQRFTAGKWKTFDSNVGIPGHLVKTISVDHQGKVWFGADNGLASFKQERFSSPFGKKEGLCDAFVSVIYEDSRSNLWVGTYGGLNRISNGHVEMELTSTGEPFDLVNTIYEDAEGDIWVGTKDGLTQLKPRRVLVYGKRDGLPHNNVMSVREDKAGRMWMATWGGGLVCLDRNKMTIFSTLPGKENKGLTTDLLLSLCEDHNGDIWAGADYSGGLFRLQKNTFVHYGIHEGIEDAAVRAIYEDRANNLWVGTSRFLVRLKDGKSERFTATNGLAGETVRSIFQDHRGVIWFGTSAGISQFRDGKLTKMDPPPEVIYTNIASFHEDTNHILWIGSYGGGLIKLDNAGEPVIENSFLATTNGRNQSGTIHSYTGKQGLFSDDICEVIEDDHGSLWISSLGGIFRIKKAEFDALDGGQINSLHSVCFGKEDGMASVQCNGVSKPAGWKSKDGRLWFATTKGVVVIDPAVAMETKMMVPSVHIEEIIANKMVRKTGEQLAIEPGRGELEIRYTAPMFASPSRTHFRYKLEGVDMNWNEVGSRRVAYYNNLPPGGYRFRVVACDREGIWNEPGASVAIQLQPHIWQTWWFLATSLIIGMVGITGIVRYVSTMRLQRKLAVVEKQRAIELERSRIASDMHDHLGASLTQIGLLSELIRRNSQRTEDVKIHAGKIWERSRDIAETVDEIVWAVNRKNDTLDKLAAYIVHYAEAFFETTTVRCRLDVPSVLPNVPLASDLRHNLFLLVKESLNNVVKHADASEVWLRIAIVGGLLTISVEDNGKGFSGGEPDPFGNGLNNMQNRAQQIRGKCKVTACPGGGTKVEIVVALPAG